VDSKAIAELVRLNGLPQAYMPDQETAMSREKIRRGPGGRRPALQRGLGPTAGALEGKGSRLHSDLCTDLEDPPADLPGYFRHPCLLVLRFVVDGAASGSS